MENEMMQPVNDMVPRRLITGTFANHEHAEKAYSSLLGKGYSKDEISLVMSDDTRKKYFPDDLVLKSPEVIVKEPGAIIAEDAAIGTAVGSTIGAIIAAIAAIGTSVIIPGLGIVIAGPIAAALAGAGAGGVAGGIVGALEGAGIPENRAKLEKKINSGYIILGFHPHNDEDAAYFEREWSEFEEQKTYS